MSIYSGPRVFLAGIATIGVTLAVGLTGFAADQFLAGVFGGGVLAAVYLAYRIRSA